MVYRTGKLRPTGKLGLECTALGHPTRLFQSLTMQQTQHTLFNSWVCAKPALSEALIQLPTGHADSNRRQKE